MHARDTLPAARDEHIATYRRMQPGDRVALAFAMTEDARCVTADGIRARHPAYDEAAVIAALRRVLLGDALYRAAWPDGPFLAP